MTEIQKILLFLMSCDPGLRDIYRIVKLFDRASYPFNATEHLKPLLENDFIVVAGYFDNGTARDYVITEKGTGYLFHHFNDEEAIRFIKTMDNPEQLLMLTQAYIDKKNDSNKANK